MFFNTQSVQPSAHITGNATGESFKKIEVLEEFAWNSIAG